MAARSTSLGVLQREHWISSQGKPPLMAWSMVGDGSIGSPSLHIRSFQLSQRSLSACWIIASPLARTSTDCVARTLAIARALPSSLVRALRSPPDKGLGWYFGAIRTSKSYQTTDRRLLERGPAAVLFVAAGPLPAGVVQQPLADVFPEGLGAGPPAGIGVCTGGTFPRGGSRL